MVGTVVFVEVMAMILSRLRGVLLTRLDLDETKLLLVDGIGIGIAFSAL